MDDYESLYFTAKQRKKLLFGGHRPMATCNWFGLKKLKSFSKMLLDWPMFGLLSWPIFELNSHLIVAGLNKRDGFQTSGCEFCFMTLSIANSNAPISLPTDQGMYQFELSCMYEPHVKSQCHRNLSKLKSGFFHEAKRNGEILKQYYNTPSCDKHQRFQSKHFDPDVYERLLKTKKYWDSTNMFNHCFSVGSTKQDCCPKPI